MMLVGQLCRERFAAESVALVGMGTHQGAADDWDGDMKVKQVNPSRSDSVERLFHDAGIAQCLLDLSHDTRRRAPCVLRGSNVSSG